MNSNALFDLTGRVAIVTGGNGGLGKGIALGLATAGADIVIAARNEQKSAEASAEIAALGVKTLPIKTDVTVEKETKVMVAANRRHLWQRVDILVNNAGIAIRRPPEEYSLEEWDQVLQTNLRSAFLCSREVYPHMKGAGGGKIINVGSMTSIFGSDWVASYSASKGGVVQLARSLALAWAKDNIQVNSLLPGWFTTDLTAAIPQQDPQRYEQITGAHTGGTLG